MPRFFFRGAIAGGGSAPLEWQGSGLAREKALDGAVAVSLLHLLEGGGLDRAVATPAQVGMPEHGEHLGRRDRGGGHGRGRLGALHVPLNLFFCLARLTTRHWHGPFHCPRSRDATHFTLCQRRRRSPMINQKLQS
jgi:hypothetical protein